MASSRPPKSASLAAAARSPGAWALPATALALLLLVWLGGVNETLFLTLNQAAAALPDRFWGLVTTLGDAHVLLALALVAAYRYPALFWLLVAGAIITFFATHIPKELAGVARPPAELAPGSFNLIGVEVRSRAFPSGHTASAFLVSAALFLATNSRRLRAVIIAYAVLIGVSRIAVGIHWPADVLAGATVGWTAALLAALYINRHPGGERTPWQTIQVVVLGLALVTLPGADLGYDTRWLQIPLSVAIVAVLGFNLFQSRPWRDPDFRTFYTTPSHLAILLLIGTAVALLLVLGG